MATDSAPRIHHARDLRSARAAILTVSDTRTRERDESGDAIESMLLEAGHRIQTRSVVIDDEIKLREAFGWLACEDLDMIISTGGTGIATRDITYEVVAKLLGKRLDGFGEAFRRLSWDEIGPRAVLSRAIAGTIGAVLVFALPGSPKAVRLAMREIILPIATHATGLLNREASNGVAPRTR